MALLILLKTALRILWRHATRSLLTILGIMIGIAAIVVTFSIGRGAQLRVKEQFTSLGEHAMYIIPGNIIERGRIRAGSAPVKLKIADLYAIHHECAEIEEISRGHESFQIIEYGANSARGSTSGVDANWPQITDTKVQHGTFFNEYHVNRRMNVVVLGAKIAQNLFKNDNPVGKTIRIAKKPFTVIGVMNYLSFWGANDPNTRVLIPFTTAKKYFKAKNSELEDDLSFIALNMVSNAQQTVAKRKVMRVLRFNHGLGETDIDDFTIFDQESITSAASQATNVVQLFGLLAASISLLVGGIGIMNIMLVSIQERTREIGIRLAIGATQASIQLQFLFEAITLSTIGGIIGILLGIGVQKIIASVTNLPGVIEVMPMLVSFLITILVGIFFGFYPAQKASRLNPVDALQKK